MYTIRALKKGGKSLNAKEIGNYLRVLRGDTNQDIVAQRCGISRSALSMYENGERIPRDEIKVKLARFYNKTVEDIFFTHKVHDTCTERA
jgi:putative transcriptional regulator